MTASNGGWSLKTLKGVIFEAGAYLEKHPPPEEEEMTAIQEEGEDPEGEKHEQEETEKDAGEDKGGEGKAYCGQASGQLL